MRNAKRKSSIIVALIAIMIMLIPAQSIAYTPLDVNKDITLKIKFTPEVKGDEQGTIYDVYQVATTTNHQDYTMCEGFEAYSQDDFVGKETSEVAIMAQNMAITIEGSAGAISPKATATTDASGIASFTKEAGFTSGVYLVIGRNRVTEDDTTYIFTPFIVSLPGQDADTWEYIYDLEVNDKHTYEDDSIVYSYEQYKVLKVWDDEGYEDVRPKEISVTLYQDSKAYDEVKLNQSNNWTYEWKKLEAAHEYTVRETDEDALKSYTVSYDSANGGITITNKYNPPETPPETPPQTPPQTPPPQTPPTTVTRTPVRQSTLPQTGLLMWPIPVLAGCGLLFFVFGLMKRRSNAE